MTSAILMIFAVAACFVAAVLNLALDTAFRKRLMRGAIIAAAVIGSVFYGYGYAWCMGLSLTSLIRALLALCRMFGGVNDLSSIQSAPLLQYPWALTVFWLGHFLAFYVMASTAITVLGERLLRRIRATLLRKGPLLLIYGINAHSVAYGRNMAHKKGRSVIFVDQEYNPALESSIKAFGAVIEKSADALAANARFLRQINIRPGSRLLELAALHADGHNNLRYARALLDTLTECGIQPEQTSLLAAGIGEEAAALQSLGGSGYGSVYAFDDYELVARLIFRKHPPCNLIAFDETGCAKEDFHGVILGFGRMGRAVLTQMVMNAQFHGSHFRADIFDPGAQNGFLFDHPLMRQYDVRFHGIDGTTDGFYRFLKENRNRIQTIILCTGSQEKNREIAGDLANWLPWGEKTPLILQATREGYAWLDENRHEIQGENALGEESLDLEEMDAAAMQINHIYCKQLGSMRTAQQDWRACDYFNRQSSRACADFYPAILRASGKTAEQVLSGDWPPPDPVLENLSITEHLRWCAFQFVSGFAPMPPEIWERRAEQYRQGTAPDFRISKDGKERLQACLVPWEELDALSQKENAVTGGRVDYKQMDRSNVMMLAQVLSALKQTKENAKP